MANNFVLSRALRAGAVYDELMEHEEYSQKQMYLNTRRIVREALDLAAMNDPGDYAQRRSEIFRVINDLARGRFVLRSDPTAAKGLAPSQVVIGKKEDLSEVVAPAKSVVQPKIDPPTWTGQDHTGEEYVEIDDGVFEWKKKR